MDTHRMKPLAAKSRLFLLALLASAALISCNRKQKLVKIDPEFGKYIEAYTSGVISKKSSIRIQLAIDAVTAHAINEPLKTELFDFSPAVKGTAYWIDARTIEFKPEKDLQPDQLYQASFSLGKVLRVPEKYRDFRFNMQVTKPGFKIEEEGLRSTGKNRLELNGTVFTADVEDSKKVEQLLSASLNQSKLKIDWQHNEEDKTHRFAITEINRSNGPGVLFLSWSGEALGLDRSDKKELQVPAIGDFRVMNVRAVQEEEQYVLVQFSDPVKVGQMLEGLISINEQESLSYTINGSEVKVYTPARLYGNYTVYINEGIENLWGEKLAKGFTSNLYFENRLPSVRIHGSGNILPNSGGKIVLPFDATNLKAVDVSVVRIYETNVAQFLQRNDLGGENELRRVAKPLVQATVRLDGDKSLNLTRKNRFSLDLDKYVQPEPGAIYRVTIGFRPDYSTYNCTVTAGEKDDEESEEDYYYYESYGDNSGDVDEDEQFWNNYDTWYPYGHNWEEKDNPCHRSYYNKERFESRNIISSNIGLTAKRGSDNSLLVVATDLISTDPMNEVELQVLDYQQQVVAKASTDNEGIALMDVRRKPYLVIARKGQQKGYLKIDDGSALPLSRFDVSGASVKNGIKGFIFGERGVWRPGDSLFLGFIIEDKDRKLPADHPIEMQLISPKGQLYKKLVQTNAEDGFNVFRTATHPEAPTGNWICRINVGGANFEKKLKIETVMPNRLKINLDFGGVNALGKGASVNGTLAARWLFGAVAQNLKAKVEAQLYRRNTTFPKFEEYEFDNPTAAFSAQSKTIFDGALSAEGKAIVSPAFEVNENAPGMLLANLVVKVFEPGGNFSIDNVSMPYHPYSSYAGLRVPEPENYWGYLSINKPQQFQIVDVNTEGTLVPGATEVEVELYRIQWRWWWDNSS
ncbi:MAG TPA: MG2 domain-containing protein, partial [Chitinophagaceae bacterium]